MPPILDSKRFRKFFVIVLAFALGISVVVYFMPPTDIMARVKAASTMLDQVRKTHIVHPNDELQRLPLPRVHNAAKRKTLFIAAMLEPIVSENQRILNQRNRAIHAKRGSVTYAALATAYGLKPNVSRAALLTRIDIVPTSLALAQSAIESAWGRSRFAQEGNAFFGEHTYDEDTPGLIPANITRSATPLKVKSFPSARMSVRSFMKTLNTHPTYRALRKHRAALRAKGIVPTGEALAPYLLGYSEIGTAYIERITSTIQAGAFQEFDDIKLASD